MTMPPRIGPEVLEQAKRYAVDRSSRRQTRGAFDDLRRADTDVLEDLVSRLRVSSDDADRALAAVLAPALGPRAAAEALLAAVDREDEPAVLAAVAEGLRAAGAGFSAEELKRLAHHPSIDVRRAVAANLYGAKDDSSFAVLLDLAKDFDADVRDWAAWALVDNFPRSARRDTALRHWLRDARRDSQLAARVERELSLPDRAVSPPRKEPAKKRGRREYAGVQKVTVLVTSANPIDTDELALDDEVREITASLRQTPRRDVVDLRVALAARPLDLLVELNEHRPQVLHFSGHGLPDGRVVFRDRDGYAKPVDGEAIAAALHSAGESVRVVVLNACFTAALADALTEHIDVAVGMERPVGDQAARVFAQAFYAALGHGLSVARAFEQARAALMLEGIPEHTTPRLSWRRGVDPNELVLTDRALVSKPDPAADRARLEELSAQHLDHLSRHATLPVGDGIAIQRLSQSTLLERAEAGSMFVVGPPGAGKSACLYVLADDLTARSRDLVVLSADLLGAGGRRGLQDELGLDLELVDALAAWPGTEPAFLLIDGLDAARGREASGVLLDVVRRVAERGGRWRVVASIRSFDLRHSPELQATVPSSHSEAFDDAVDPEFAPVRHFAVSGLSDPELAQVAAAAPAVGRFLDSAAAELVELLRTPFNLRLLIVLLLRGGGDSARLHQVRTQLQLLDLYWEHRVLAPPDGRDSREQVAARFCELAVSELRLQLPRSSLRRGDAGGGLDQMLREGVLVERRAAGAGGDRVGFAHHILFDYSVHRLLLSGEPDEIAGELAAPDIVLLARPSLVLTLLAEWEADPTRQRFWRLALRLGSDDVAVPARLVAPAVFVGEARRVEDARYVLVALDHGDRNAAFLIRHLVGAVSADGLPSRPLAHANLRLWLDIAAELSTRLAPETAYALRILVWGLTAEGERLPNGLAALGHAAREFLVWGWENDPGASATLAVAIEAVARTCETEPDVTKDLLSTALRPDRWVLYGPAEVRQVVDEVGSLAACVPSFVAEVFERVFGHDDESEERTSLGVGQIVPLTSTRRQDWDMVRYSLAREYPALLTADKRAALRALRAACAREAGRYRNGRSREQYEVALNGSRYRLVADDSAYWDGAGLHREGVEMLDQFERALQDAAERGGHEVDEWLEALACDPTPEAIWRRVFRAGAGTPQLLGRMLAPMASELPVILSRNLRDVLGELLRDAAASWTDDQLEAVEASLLRVPAAFRPEQREIGEHVQAELLACLPAQRLQTEEGRSIRARAAREGIEGPQPPIRVTTSWGAIDPEQELRDRGIDPGSSANGEVLAAIAPVSEFARAHTNATPSLEQARAAVPAIRALEAVLARQRGAADQPLVEEAEAWLSEAAAALAAQTPLPLGDESLLVARELALAGASAAIPSHIPETLADFDRGGPAWGVPSGRIDAARALLLLCREEATADTEVLAAAEQLSEDPNPAVRWMVARSLVSAVGTQPDWTWKLAARVADEERSAQVREAVLHALARLASDRPDEVVELLRSMYAAEAAAGAHESLLRAISDFLVEMWVWRGHRGGRQLVDEWIADIRTAPARPRQVFFALRSTVTHGGSSVEHFAVRERAISVWADLTRAALEAFQDELPLMHEAGADEAVKERVSSLASLLDGSATEVYFASGAYGDSERQLSPEVRERFYREASPLIDVLVEVGVPSAAHHMLETLASFVDFDPRGVLLRVGRLLEAGRAWGYQLEGLAETEFVRLVQRYLASHRDLFVRDRESRLVLINATEGFVEAGWPSARRLLYGFDDMFR